MKNEKPDFKNLPPEVIQRMVDDQTIFVLAALAMDLHVATQLRNQPIVVNTFMKINVAINSNPGFAERFRKLQEQVKKAAGVVDKGQVPSDILTADNPGAASKVSDILSKKKGP